MMRRSALIAGIALPLAIVSGTSPAHAQETRRDGVTFAPSASVGTHELVLRGTGTRTVTIFGITVFVGGLYTPRRDLSAAAILDEQTPKRFRAVFRRRVDHDDAAKSFRKAIVQSAGGAAPSMQDEIARFVSWLPTFDSGSELQVEYLPESGLTVRVAGNRDAREPLTMSTKFAEALFGTWVGPRAIDEGLRESLLSGR